LVETTRGRLLADGIPAADIAVQAALDCRYVGQGYELRVPLPEQRFTDDALAQFHRLHEQEYGHAMDDPIEAVNLRVTAFGKRPKLGQPRVSPGALADALLGEGESVFRENGSLAAQPTRYLERARLPVDEQVLGPAVVFQRDTTVLVPPGWAAQAHLSGNLLLRRSRA
ncbi:MAG: hydantoinase/oxoprolinase family protein, partial [Gaiellales bacterium]